MLKFILKGFFFLILIFLSIEFCYGKYPSIFSIRVFYTQTITKIDRLFKDQENTNKLFINHKNPNGLSIKIKENNIGFNSHIDFVQNELSESDYAVIGDSFVASYKCGTYNSISYFLDSINGSNKVYNFGIPGGNIHDYFKVYDKYNLNRFKYVFCLLTGSMDLNYMYANSKNIETSITYLPFDLNFNTFLSDKKNKQMYDSPNFQLLKSNRENIVFITHQGLKSSAITQFDKSLKVMDLSELSLEIFYDGHYTKNANRIIADYIFNYINKLDE